MDTTMKNIIILIVFALVVTSCGPSKKQVSIYNPVDGKDGDSCTSEQFDAGVMLHCGDTTSVVYNGKDGENGLDGADGLNGEDGTDGLDGQDGTDGVDGQDGEQGEPGENGSDGEDGEDATGLQIASYTSSQCTEILDTGLFAKYNGTNVSLFNNPFCDNPKTIQINDGESYWISDSLLGIKSKNTFRVINFGE